MASFGGVTQPLRTPTCTERWCEVFLFPTQGGTGVRWLGSVRHGSQGAELLKVVGKSGGGGGGRRSGGVHGLLSGQGSAASGGADHRSLVAHEEEIFKVFSQDSVNWDSRFVEQKLETLRVSLVMSDVGLVGLVSDVLEAFRKNVTHVRRVRAVFTGDPGFYFYELFVLAVTGSCVPAFSQRRLSDEFLSFSL